MESQLPPTPGRGRSRFSKALPVPPPEPKTLGLASTLQTKYSSSAASTPRYSPLPALPSGVLPPKKTIPRRPIGGAQPSSLKMPSRKSSSSSLYSDTPGLPGNESVDGDKGRENERSSSSLTSPVSEDDILSFYGSVEQTSSPSNILSNPSSGLQKSPPRPELWRRRSVKSDKSISLTELKLDKSNGSTASPPSRTQLPSDRALPAIPFALPRSKASTGIPGRKPVPLRPAPPQPTAMGNNLAKLKQKQSNGALADSISKSDVQTLADNDITAANQQSFTLPLHRSPTPEAEKMDMMKSEEASAPKVLSPAPPHTPPDDATAGAPLVPQKSRARRPLGEATMFSTSKNRSDLTIDSTSGASSTTTIRPMPERSTSQPQQQQQPNPQFFQPQPPFTLPPLQSPPPTQTLPPAPTTTSTPATSPPPPANIYFPTIPSKAPEGTYFQPPALDIVHLNCFHNHRTMRPSQNKIYPVLCMVCQKPDPNTHWKCTWKGFEDVSRSNWGWELELEIELNRARGVG
ncbi:hypothetical protein B7463_g10125, partial [Scytalidium lignicola]